MRGYPGRRGNRSSGLGRQLRCRRPRHSANAPFLPAAADEGGAFVSSDRAGDLLVVLRIAKVGA
jgi:hypothetical protein